jgi:lipopolysaccharide biosynthesis glycosyltransferase
MPFITASRMIKRDVAPFEILARKSAQVAKWCRRRLLDLSAESTLEIHIPISPTPSFFTMIHYLAASLRANGGAFAGAKLIVSVGEDCEPFDIDARHPELLRYGINWRWVDRKEFREGSYFSATDFNRFVTPFEADFVLMADADICVVRPFSDIIQRLSKPKSIAGVIATGPPFMARGAGNVDRRRWRELFQLAGLGEPPWDCVHPGYGVVYREDEGILESPPYYNFGFVLGTRDAMNAIRETYAADCLLAKDYMKTDLYAQAGLALSIVRNNISYNSLPVRYNFWSTDFYLSAFPEEAADIRILHYLMPPFRKHQDIRSHAEVGRWLAENRGSYSPIVRLLVAEFDRAHALVQADFNRISDSLPHQLAKAGPNHTNATRVPEQ